MRAYDKLAGLNHIPYYDNAFGQVKFDVTIKYQENEVTRLLNDPILTLDGSTTENLDVYKRQSPPCAPCIVLLQNAPGL